MNGRERYLFIATVGIFAVALAYIVFMKLLITPASEAKAQAQEVELQIEKLRDDINYGKVNHKRLVRWASATFGDDANEASEKVRAHLQAMLNAVRLGGDKVTMNPLSPRRARSTGAKEIGWTVRTTGSLAQITDLLFALQTDPQLHRVDTVIFSPLSKSTQVDLSFRYVTLVFEDIEASAESKAKALLNRIIADAGFLGEDVLVRQVKPQVAPAGDEKQDTPTPPPSRIAFDLEISGEATRLSELDDRLTRDPYLQVIGGDGVLGEGDAAELQRRVEAKLIVVDPKVPTVDPRDDARKPYNLIASRDVFRPYIKKPPPPPEPRPERRPRIDPLTQLKLVGLPTWRNDPKVVVKNTESGDTKTYDVGQELLGGEIVMVDYREIPGARDRLFTSPSRLIVLVGQYFWSVELGQTLAEKRRVPDNLVPQHLLEKQQAAEAKAKALAEEQARKKALKDEEKSSEKSDDATDETESDEESNTEEQADDDAESPVDETDSLEEIEESKTLKDTRDEPSAVAPQENP